MNLKSVLKISSLVMVLGLVSLTPLKTYADFINTVDNEGIQIERMSNDLDLYISEVTEISKDNESEEFDETDEKDETGTYDEVELESEQNPDLELNDDSFDKEVLEEDVDSVEDKASENEDSVEEIEMSNAGVVLVSNETQLRSAFGNAPTDGTLRIIEVGGNFDLANAVSVPSGTNIMLRSNNVNQSRTLTRASILGPRRHFEIRSNATFILGDGIILTSSRSDGGIIVDSNGKFRMIGGEISGNHGQGGTVVQVNGGTFTMEGGEISRNTSNSGGAVHVDGGTFTMEGGEISRNTSIANSGGAVRVNNGGTFTMEDGEISGNRAFSGGGVHVDGGTFTMEGGEISDNTASGSGGGVRVANGARFAMEGGQINENTASGDGGGISLAGANTSVDLTGSGIEIFDNESGGVGGGIAANNVSNVFLNNIQIFDNEAQYGGGFAGISNNTHAELTGVHIHNNTAFNRGGGIYLTQINQMTLNHTVIEGNEAVRAGGMYVGGNIGELVIDGGQITSNEADVVGGIYVSYAEAIDNISISRITYVAGNMTTTNIPIFINSYNERHNINANGRINPRPWDGVDDSHVFNTIDMNPSSFEVVVRLKYNFEGSDETIFKQVELDVTDGVQLSPEFWNEYIAGKIPDRLGYNFIGWSFTPEGETIDNTQLDNELILEDLNLYAQWELNPAYLNVSIPTAVFFQSSHVDATQLVSPRYTITNNSIIGVHVDVDNFEATNATGIDLIEELNIRSTPTGSTPIRLITNGSIGSIPINNSRLLEIPGLTDGSFEFSGRSNVTTQVENPSFNLVLRFEVFESGPGIVFPDNPEEMTRCHADNVWTDPETDVNWCVLVPASDSRGGLGNVLLITEQTVSIATNSSIIGNTDNWFNNPANVSNDLRAIALNTEVAPAMGNSTESATGENTFMLPQVNSAGNGRAFPLSGVEIEHYFANNADRVATGTSNFWWLRSWPVELGGTSNWHFVFSDGSLFGGNTANAGLRPALWISTK